MRFTFKVGNIFIAFTLPSFPPRYTNASSSSASVPMKKLSNTISYIDYIRSKSYEQTQNESFFISTILLI